MNVIKTVRGKSGKTYVINDKFLKEEKAMIVNNELSNVNKRAILEEETYQYNTIDKIISNNRGNLDNILDDLATLPAETLKSDTKNVYYCRLAIERKEELARQKNLVDPKIIQRELKKITKEKNFAYKRKKEYNIKHGIKPWEK
jgi:hypothetical protein